MSHKFEFAVREPRRGLRLAVKQRGISNANVPAIPSAPCTESARFLAIGGVGSRRLVAGSADALHAGRLSDAGAIGEPLPNLFKNGR